MGYRKSDLQFSIGCRERGQIFISKYEAYHLNLSAWQITSSEKLFLYEIYTNNFSTNFVAVISQEQNQQSCWNFYTIFVIIRNRQAKLFSVITQPWRHPGAILWIHIIIHIFITIHHKLTKFNTHKLKMISQHMTILVSVRVTTRTCARVKILPCSKSPINNFEHEPGHLEYFQIFRPYVSARALCARAARMNGRKFKIFTWFGFLIQQLTISIDFQSLLTFHKAVRARQSLKSARAAMGNIMQKWAKTCHFSKQNSS